MYFNMDRLTKPYVWAFEDMKNFLSNIAEAMEKDNSIDPIRLLNSNNEFTEIFLDSIIPYCRQPTLATERGSKLKPQPKE